MRLASTLLLVMSLAACGGDDDGGGGGGGGDGGGGGGDRGPIAIGDLNGSCADSGCDGQASSGNCYCDDQCAHYADCCDDYDLACAPEGAPTCGGFGGNSCERPTYCHYAPSDVCGAGDQVGTCVRPPDDCVEDVVSVCGCDGVTYDNACLAAQSGTSVQSDGDCR
jgi:hypothetical protein